jgi:hypothetical protein
MTVTTAPASLNRAVIIETVFTDLCGRTMQGNLRTQFDTDDIVRIMDNAERIYADDRVAKALYVGYMTNSGMYAVLPAAHTFVSNVVLTNGDVITAGIVLENGEQVQEVGTAKTYGSAAVVSYSVFKRS